jgi:hypothetical protein
MKWIFDMPIHITVHLWGRCKACNAVTENQIYDYGKKKYGEVEKEIDKVRHQITPLVCSRCGTQFSPELLIYKDQLSKRIISKVKIDWGNALDESEVAPLFKGHEERFTIFKEHEEEFWEKFCSYALNDFKKAISELNKYEFEDAYQKMDIDVQLNTVTQYRKDAIQRFTNPEDQTRFWREANHFFIYDHFLELGLIAWDPKAYMKEFGENRTRFVVLTFPLAEEYVYYLIDIVPIITMTSISLNDIITTLHWNQSMFLTSKVAMLSDIDRLFPFTFRPGNYNSLSRIGHSPTTFP